MRDQHGRQVRVPRATSVMTPPRALPRPVPGTAELYCRILKLSDARVSSANSSVF